MTRPQQAPGDGVLNATALEGTKERISHTPRTDRSEKQPTGFWVGAFANARCFVRRRSARGAHSRVRPAQRRPLQQPDRLRVDDVAADAVEGIVE